MTPTACHPLLTFISHLPRTSRPQVVGVRSGFTLLEVILSLVVLGGALAVLSEVMQLASRHAVEARAESRAQALAASLMDQLLAGAIPVEQASREPLEVDDDVAWVYSVGVGTSAIAGIAPVEVVVEQDLEARLNPVRFRLLRWLPTTLETPESAMPAQAAGGSPQGGDPSSGGPSSGNAAAAGSAGPGGAPP